jgi:hypothetical protein
MNMMPSTLENEGFRTKIFKDELKREQAPIRLTKSVGSENTGFLKSEYNITDNDLIHEHDFVTEMIGAVSYLHCITCNKYFCQFCGKSVTGNLDFKSENGK